MRNNHYIRKNDNQKAIFILNNLIKGYKCIPIDPPLLVRQSKNPSITAYHERRAYTKYHQYYNHIKILHYNNIKNILANHDNVMEMILCKIKHNFIFGYYIEQYIFEFLKCDCERFNYDYYTTLFHDLYAIQPSKYMKLGLMMMNRFPENFENIDKEIFIHDLLVQQNECKDDTGKMRFQSSVDVRYYFHNVLVEHDIINQYIYCDLCRLIDYYT
jgi:hypothetical protein